MQKTIRAAMGVGLLALCCVMVANVATASVIITLNSVTPSGSDFIWNYSATLAADQNFINGNFTEVIDFGGFVSASWVTAPGGLTVVNAGITEQFTGPGIPPVGASDSATILNVVVHNLGGTVTGSTLGGALDNLGELLIVSTSGTVAGGATPTGSFSTVAQKASDGLVTLNQGFVPTPTQPATGNPEPMTLSLMGAGLLGLGLLRRQLQKLSS